MIGLKVFSLYVWCRSHNVEFRICFTSPFSLEDYLIPNMYDWRIDKDEISYSLSDSQPVIHMYLFTPSDFRKLGETDILSEEYFDRRFPSIRKRQIHVYSNAVIRSAKSFFSELFNELFRPSENLRELIDIHKRKIGGNYISISFRFTTLLGDFYDCTGIPLGEVEAQEYIDICLSSIDKISRKASPHNKILVTSDSTLFLSKLKCRDDIYIIPGEIEHIQYQTNSGATMKPSWIL